jgi:hypothetical protein
VVYVSSDSCATLQISDLGSTNGTFLNGNAHRLEPGVKTSIVEDDQIEMGRWTRITFRHRSPV